MARLQIIVNGTTVIDRELDERAQMVTYKIGCVYPEDGLVHMAECVTQLPKEAQEANDALRKDVIPPSNLAFWINPSKIPAAKAD